MPSTNYAYVSGRVVPEREARVSIFDRGFLYGEGVFETMRVYGGRMFRALEHFDRMFDGLNALGIESPFSPEELLAVCRALVRYNNVGNGVARVYLTRDSIVCTVQPQTFPPRELRAIVSRMRVDASLSRYKTANRLPYILAQREAMCEGVDEAVLLNAAGQVAEFAASNLFAVKDGSVFTPPLDDGPLPGITRRAVMTVAAAKGIPLHEKSFGVEFLETADEVFATNSLMEIAPVTTWSRVREITSRLQEAYREVVREELGL
jgi:branched-subunit amino acid aminotransferase/4-amino-4-deoxychorismate lyase